MKYLISVILSLLLVCNPVSAQNLIKNPSFEEILYCPQRLGEIKSAVNWSAPSYGTPDLFNLCDTIKQISGYLGLRNRTLPYLGNGFAGLVLVFGSYYSHQEYLQGELLEPLQKDSTYKIEFYMKIYNESSYYVDRISVAFTKYKNLKSKWIKGYELLYSKKAVTIKNDTLFNQPNWFKVETTFVAKGGEQYITIGLFGNTFKKKDFKKVINHYIYTNNRSKETYYFIDEVSLEKR